MIQPEMPIMEGPNCPLPISERGHIVIGHGSGGQMTQDLVRDVFQKRLANTILNTANDAASIPATPPGKRLVVSTDAHIVSPLFFAGGDIGRLAVCGTVSEPADESFFLGIAQTFRARLVNTSWRCAMAASAPRRWTA